MFRPTRLMAVVAALVAAVAAVVAVAAVAFLVAMPSAASAAPADACKNGGYANYVDSTGAPFKNQGQCVSYVAGGGTLTPVPTSPSTTTVTPPPTHPPSSVSLTFQPTSDPAFCTVVVNLVGGSPNTTYDVTIWAFGVSRDVVPVTTDSSGNASQAIYSFGKDAPLYATVDGVQSPEVTVSC